jgi:hypothetical protein
MHGPGVSAVEEGEGGGGEDSAEVVEGILEVVPEAAENQKWGAKIISQSILHLLIQWN